MTSHQWQLAMWLAIGLVARTSGATPAASSPVASDPPPAGTPAPVPSAASLPKPSDGDPDSGAILTGEALRLWLQPPPPDQPQPKLVLSPTGVADGGVVWYGNCGTVQWNLKNDGDAPLRVFILCGCDAYLVRGARQRVLVPGTTEPLKIGFGKPVLTSARGAQRIREVWLSTNDSRQPSVELEIEYEFRRAVVASADGRETMTLRLGDPPGAEDRMPRMIPRDVGSLHGTMLLARGDGGPLALQIEQVDPLIPVEQGSVTLREIEAGERYALDVDLRPPWPNHLATTKVYLITGVEQEPSTWVQIIANITPRLRHWYGTGQGAVPLVRRAPVEWTTNLIWSDESPPGRVTSITSPVVGLSGRIEDRDGKQVLVVTIGTECPSPESGYHRLKLRTDDPAVPELEVAVPFEKLRPAGGASERGTATTSPTTPTDDAGSARSP